MPGTEHGTAWLTLGNGQVGSKEDRWTTPKAC
jgi:hypothetical protein